MLGIFSYGGRMNFTVQQARLCYDEGRRIIEVTGLSQIEHESFTHIFCVEMIGTMKCETFQE